MKASSITTLVAAGAAAAAFACAGPPGGPANPDGFVQISAASFAPLAISCGTTLTNPPKNIAGPDTLLVQVQMVNTTANDALVTNAGAFGVVMVSTDPDDVGDAAANFLSVPFAPSPTLLAARYGNLPIRVSVPMDPVCQTKPLFYSGEQDINISARMSATSGQYVTDWATIKVVWR